MQIEEKLAEWEQEQQLPESTWAYTAEEAVLPPECAFGNRYHVYRRGMASARIWNHYRWARILVNRTVLELTDHTQPLDLRDRDGRLETIRRMAEDILVSVPTHYRHPRLTRAQRDMIDRTCQLQGPGGGPGGGIGAAGVPGLMAQLEVAGSAPGVPREYGEWAHQVMETVFADTGMVQAQRLAGQLRAHLDRSPRVKIELVEVKEEHKP